MAGRVAERADGDCSIGRIERAFVAFDAELSALEAGGAAWSAETAEALARMLVETRRMQAMLRC